MEGCPLRCIPLEIGGISQFLQWLIIMKLHCMVFSNAHLALFLTFSQKTDLSVSKKLYHSSVQSKADPFSSFLYELILLASDIAS